MCTRYPIINRVSELKVHIELTRFVQPEKIEIDANERAVNEKSQYCFFVCTTFDSFLNDLAALKLHNPIYNGYNKRVYFGTVMFLSDDKEYVPLEFISPYSRAERYLSEMEAYLIERLNPELNKKKEPLHLLENLSSVLIQNFSEENAFMKDFFV